MDRREFRDLLERLAAAWGRQDTDAALDCFTDDAEYMEPPDGQLFVGRDELRPFFADLEPGTTMTWHGCWLDEEGGTGAGEFTFAEPDEDEADHGVAIVTLRDGRISTWREYLTRGPAEFERFVARDAKTWRWHIGSYQ
jgi:ketosteroid isomerase-like protein